MPTLRAAQDLTSSPAAPSSASSSRATLSSASSTQPRRILQCFSRAGVGSPEGHPLRLGALFHNLRSITLAMVSGGPGELRLRQPAQSAVGLPSTPSLGRRTGRLDWIHELGLGGSAERGGSVVRGLELLAGPRTASRRCQPPDRHPRRRALSVNVYLGDAVCHVAVLNCATFASLRRLGRVPRSRRSMSGRVVRPRAGRTACRRSGAARRSRTAGRSPCGMGGRWSSRAARRRP